MQLAPKLHNQNVSERSDSSQNTQVFIGGEEKISHQASDLLLHDKKQRSGFYPNNGLDTLEPDSNDRKASSLMSKKMSLESGIDSSTTQQKPMRAVMHQKLTTLSF